MLETWIQVTITVKLFSTAVKTFQNETASYRCSFRRAFAISNSTCRLSDPYRRNLFSLYHTNVGCSLRGLSNARNPCLENDKRSVSVLGFIRYVPVRLCRVLRVCGRSRGDNAIFPAPSRLLAVSCHYVVVCVRFFRFVSFFFPLVWELLRFVQGIAAAWR